MSASRSAPPPSLQEVTRKLSVHSAARPLPKQQPQQHPAPISGTESDSDSVLSPEAYAASPLTAPAPALQAIAERRSGSGEESEEDEEDEEGGWRTQTAARPRDDTVLKTGYLWKKGERRKTWKKRWFVLRPAHLAFYKTAAEYKLLRLLELSEIHSCTPVQLKKHQNTFVLVSPTRTFYLQADAPQEVTEWVKAVTDARTALQATSTQSSVVTAPIPIPRTSAAAPLQGRHSYQQQAQQQQQPIQQSHSQAAVPASPSLSHSPYNHHLTSSESEDASSSVPRAAPPPPPATPGAGQEQAKQTGPIDPSKVVLSGYLMKCGSRRHIWHNRWFVLTGDKLVYTRSHMDNKPHRSIPLSQILDALEYDLPARPLGLSPPSDEHTDGGAGKHTFKIVTTKRTLLVCAPSEEEEIKWLSAVRALIARRALVPGDSASPSPHSHSQAQQHGHGHAHSMPPAPAAITPGAPIPILKAPTSVSTSASVPIPSASDQVGSSGSGSGHTRGASTSSASGGTSPTLVPSSSGVSGSGSGVGGVGVGGGSGAGAGAGSPQRRRDSIARRLSLSGAGSFLAHPTLGSMSGGGSGPAASEA